jgi:hypothetical protein
MDDLIREEIWFANVLRAINAASDAAREAARHGASYDQIADEWRCWFHEGIKPLRKPVLADEAAVEFLF